MVLSVFCKYTYNQGIKAQHLSRKSTHFVLIKLINSILGSKRLCVRRAIIFKDVLIKEALRMVAILSVLYYQILAPVRVDSMGSSQYGFHFSGP